MTIMSSQSSETPLCTELREALVAFRSEKKFCASEWLVQRAAALNSFMGQHALRGCIVNVSGGVDSAVVLCMCRYAASQKDSPIQRVVAVSQPIESSPWSLERTREVVSQCGAEHILVDQTEIFHSLSFRVRAAMTPNTATDFTTVAFTTGQLKSYMRTPVVYFVAQILSQEQRTPSVVVGTGNYDEDGYLGYFCKAGDGVVDVQMIHDLHKSEVYDVARALQVPSSILSAPPSADLWEGQTDEQELGFPYDFVELLAHVGCIPGPPTTTPRTWDEERFLATFVTSKEAREQYMHYKSLVTKVHQRNQHKLTPGPYLIR